MKFGLTTLTGLLLAIASALPSQAGFELSIGNISVNGAGGGFTVFARATGQNEVVSSYTLRLNLTNASGGELPVTFAEGPGQVPGFTYIDSIPNNTISVLNGNSGAVVGGNAATQTVGFTGALLGPAMTFTQGNTVQVGTFTFSTNNGFTAGDFVDVGFLIGTLDTSFSGPAGGEATLTAVGANGATNPTSTRISAVPEPSTFGLLGLVGAGIGLRRKRKV